MRNDMNSDLPSHVDSGGSGDVVVLLHGFGGTHHGWDPVIPDLPRDCRIMAVDLPGHGDSISVPDRSYSRRVAAAVLALLDAKGIEAAHLCGFSLGGAIACVVAAMAPDRALSLTLVAPGGFGPQIAGDALKALAMADSDEGLSRALKRMMAPGFAMPAAEIRQILDGRARDGATERLLTVLGMIVRDGRQGELPSESLTAITCPVRVIWGTADPVLPFAQTRNLPHDWLLRPVEGAGHMLLEEAPRAVGEILRTALAASQTEQESAR